MHVSHGSPVYTYGSLLCACAHFARYINDLYHQFVVEVEDRNYVNYRAVVDSRSRPKQVMFSKITALLQQAAEVTSQVVSPENTTPLVGFN